MRDSVSLVKALKARRGLRPPPIIPSLYYEETTTSGSDAHEREG